MIILQALTPDLDFGACLAGDEDEWYSPVLELVQRRSGPLPGVSLMIQKSPVEICKYNLHRVYNTRAGLLDSILSIL